jgi:hypothetical protein
MTMTIHIVLQMKRRYFTLHWLTCVIGIDFCQFALQWAWPANKSGYRFEGVAFAATYTIWREWKRH